MCAGQRRTRWSWDFSWPFESGGGAAHPRQLSQDALPHERTATMIDGKDRSRMCHEFRDPLNLLVLGLALFAISVGQAREPQAGTAAATVDVERVGPQVGTSLPDFTL